MNDRLTRRVAARLARRPQPAPPVAEGFRVEASSRGVTRITPGRGIAASSAPARRHAERARRELTEYLAGRRTRFSVPLDLGWLPAFQARVLEAARRIGFGEVTSYTALAAEVGAPRAPRAVGTALARNPVPILVPCHRVVRRDGTWGPYALGARLKTTLLALERGV
jgi:methylated-DNA-[protein]-cysteine S-methyltransferase